MDIVIYSPSVAHTDILQDNISETLCEWCRLGDSNTRPTDYKILINNHQLFDYFTICVMNTKYFNF